MIWPPSPPRPALPPGPYLVAGVGRAGAAVADALIARVGASQVTVWDGWAHAPQRSTVERLRSVGVRTCFGEEGVSLVEGPEPPETLIKSPGLSFSAPLVQTALRRGVTVLDESEIGWRLDPRPMVGVTGTNGKSTCAALVAAALKAAGAPAVVAGNTLFGPPLSAPADAEVEVVVAELSSYQLEGCVSLRPEVALLTNLTPEHLARHGTLQAYGRLKRSLFVGPLGPVAAAAVGIDEPFGRELAAELRAAGSRVVTFGRHPAADRLVLEARWELGRGHAVITEGTERRALDSQLVGEHGALNLAGALALTDLLAIAPATAAEAFAATPPLPGRFETFRAPGGFTVVVDFAHNPEGIERTLETARALARPGGSLRVVCSAGFSYLAKTRLMGQAAARWADHLVLTTQRWRRDLPYALGEGLLEAVEQTAPARLDVELDRAEAIALAVRAAQPGDIVVVLERGQVGLPLFDAEDRAALFDDRQVVRRVLDVTSSRT